MGLKEIVANLSDKLTEKISNLLTRNKTPQLPEGQTVATFGANTSEYDPDRTMPIITIDTITGVIFDDEIFQRFMNFEQNMQVFKGARKEDIAEAVKIYVEFMADKGGKFDKKQQKNINKILSYLPKEVVNQKTVFKQYDGIDKNMLYNTAIGIVSEDDKLRRFLECQRIWQTYNGIPQEVISDYITSELYSFTSRITPNDQMRRNIGFICEKENTKKVAYRMNPQFPINEDFENAVFSAVKPTNDPVEYAFNLYNELNKLVKYNPEFFARDQKIQYDEFAKAIYSQRIDEVTLQKNGLVCKQWAELYAYFLEKSGIEAYVVGQGLHKSVKAYTGATIIEADATNQTMSVDDPSRLTDLTRCKLGVRPAGFKAHEFDINEMVGKDLNTITLNYDIGSFSSFKDNELLTDIINHIPSNVDLTSTIMGLNDPKSIQGSIMKKNAFISGMLKKANLDNMDSIGYLNHLFHNTLTSIERRFESLENIFYKDVGGDCKMVPIIAFNKSGIENSQEKEDFVYFEFDQDSHEIKPVSRDFLITKVVMGEYVQGRGKGDNRSIPGLPELTNREYINRVRQLWRSQGVQIPNLPTIEPINVQNQVKPNDSNQQNKWQVNNAQMQAKEQELRKRDTEELPIVDDGDER